MRSRRPAGRASSPRAARFRPPRRRRGRHRPATLAGMNEPPALLVQGITKRYGARTAVAGLDLAVERGEVVGFLGPNGAGKTTTIRMCLDLVRPTAGTARVFGLDVAREGPRALARAGALIESPALLPFLSGRDNLEFFRRARGGV